VPGIHFIHRPGEQRREAEALLRDELLHLDDYRAQVLLDRDEEFLALTSHEGYPTLRVEDERFLVILDGKLFAPEGRDAEGELLYLAARLLLEEPDAGDLRHWLLARDGDFVIWMGDKRSGRWAVLNDALGRLPLYLSREGESLRLSREIRFCRGAKRPPLDPPGAALDLLIGYPLGRRTPWRGLERLPAATLLRFDGEGVEETRLWELDLSQKSDASYKDSLAELAELFIDGCRRQGGQGEHLLALSGGLDSRLAAAGLKQAGVNLRAASFADAAGAASADVALAEEIARALDIPWQRHDLPPCDLEDRRALVAQRGGMNSAAMAFGLVFLSALRAAHGARPVYFTGDGGDKVLPCLPPWRSFRNRSALARYILDRFALFAPAEAAALLGIGVDEILHEIESRLQTYPESDGGQLYAHFLLAERAFKWLFEGEDRNRSYFWNSTPFYSLPFFRRAQQLPDAWKRRHRFFGDFMRRVSPAMADIPDANHGVPVGTAAYRRRRVMIDLLARHPRALGAVKARLRPQPGLDPQAPLALMLLESADKDEQGLDRSVIGRWREQGLPLGEEAALNLLTLLLAGKL